MAIREPTSIKDVDGRIVRKGDVVRVVGVPDLTGMSSPYDPSGFAILVFGIRSEVTMSNTFRAEIDKLRAAYEASVAKGDWEGVGTLLAQGAVMVRPGGPDWDAMATAAGGAPFPPGAKIAITPIEVVPLNQEWGYEFGTAVTTYTPAGADRAQELRDTYLILFRNTGDGWKAYREVASSAPPPSA